MGVNGSGATSEMFNKILIANRGEIACRIMRTAKRLGVKTVAVYSEADADGLHVRMADEAVCIGPAPSAQSYLRVDAILDASRSLGVDAVHPGFGFLSENADFAKAVREAGIAFIGPPENAISAMGDKIESKRLAQAAGVNTIPGFTEALRDADQAVEVARDVGFPVMLKASAGGGGKGMRVVYAEGEVRDGFSAAASEAISSFGDDRIFVEKFIEQPRHIEIQILADQHGNVIHLGERECSIQRRHQKVIEEAPSPFLDPETREAMGSQAVQLAQAVDYASVGTVEFIVDSNRQFYFLEMNTRLQVEHPVTEFITGLDLVESMIRVAQGEPLSITQADVQLKGWAVEARVYAEDPERGFLPSTGRLVRYVPPPESDVVRVDTGVDEGGEISMFYDPMVAKLVTAGATRAQAIENMASALDAYTIRGFAHNIPFLSAVVHHPRFRSGDISTAFIEEEFPDGYTSATAAHADPSMLASIAGAMQMEVDTRELTVAQPQGMSLSTPLTSRRYVVVTSGEERVERPCDVRVEAGVFEVRDDARTLRIQSQWAPGSDRFEGQVNGHAVCIQVTREGQVWYLEHAGHSVRLRVLSPRAAELYRLMPFKRPPDMSKYLLSPMPGLLMRVSVAVGEEIKAGQELAVVEAMKMENVLTATQDATVAAVLCASGDTLAVDQPIIEFE
jgi:propionyl-CoA carboxylase alpha chain